MLKWYKSFILHPIFNRLNILAFGGWIGFSLFAKNPPAFLWGVLAELVYVAVRMGLEYSGRPLWQLRFLKRDSRERYFKLLERVKQTTDDFENVKQLDILLSGEVKQIRHMSQLFLELLILRSRIDEYVKGIHENYDNKIMELKARLDKTPEGEERKLIAQNLAIYEQRRSKYFEVMEKRSVIEARLDTIENTMNLLGDYAVGMATPGREERDQVQHLIESVQDAESFMSDLKSTVPQVGVRRIRVRG
ncbi:MAG: hypothetical protein H6684_13480 [Deltaproteobacteria bacterium]|nr:hypothetical protein [bacterium]MCB9489738.1 hypothetical protein [Deltaproteobacteria bacterium]